MAKAGKEDAKRKKAKNKFPGIRIRERFNGKGNSVSWRVEVGAKITGDQRVIRQFPTKEEAETYAQGMHNQRELHGVRAFALSDGHRSDAVRALEILAPLNVSLTDAASFYARHARPPAGDRTISELIEELLAFKETRQKARARYVSDLKSRLGRFAATFGSRPVKDVRADEIESWLFEDEAIGEQTRDNYRRALGVLFGFAQGRRAGRGLTAPAYRIDNPIERVHRPVVESEPPAILSVDQANNLLLKAAETDDRKGMLGFITLALYCGLRSAELEQLKWSHVRLDGEDSIVTVPPEIAKKRRIRNVEIPENARAWLRIACRNSTGRIAPPNAVKRLPVVARTAGITPWPGNCMRHSFGSYDFALHGNAALTASRLGHRGDEVLFNHYRSLTSKSDAKRFFQLMPSDEVARVVRFEAAK